MHVGSSAAPGIGRFSSFAQLYGIEFDVAAEASADPAGRHRELRPTIRRTDRRRRRHPFPHSAFSSGGDRVRPARAARPAWSSDCSCSRPSRTGSAPYLPIAVVAALDAVFGGLRARLDDIFDAKVFVISFVANVLVAAFIVFLGDQLGVGAQLSTAVVVVLGIRIFGNAAAIRRHVFKA